MKMCMGREGESDKRESSHLHAERGCKHKLWAGTNSAADSRQRENHTPELLLTFTATHADQRCNPSPLTCRCVRLKIRRRQWLPKPVCYIIRQRGQGGREGGIRVTERRGSVWVIVSIIVFLMGLTDEYLKKLNMALVCPGLYDTVRVDN